MKNRNFVFLLLAVMLISSCTGPTPAPVVNPTEVASPTLTLQPATPTAITASVTTVPLAAPNNVPVNCRSGPGTNWPVVVLLSPPQSTEIVGRNTDNSWLYVKNPNLPGSFCWVAASFTNVTGDVSTLAVVTAPPLPPTSSFSVPAPVGTGSAAGAVTWVDVSIAPTTISTLGCNGKGPLLTVSASITTDGPVDLVWFIHDDQSRNRPVHELSFTQAGTQTVTDSFNPRLTPGSFGVQFYIHQMTLDGMNTTTLYTINC